MTFWIIALIMCGTAILLVLLPLGRRSSDVAENDDGVEFYRAQLADVDRRIETSQGSKEVLQEERAEIARRLIKAHRRSSPESGVHSNFRLPRTIASLATIVLVPAVAASLYWSKGSLGAADVPLAKQMAKRLADQPVEQLVQRAEDHLEKNPDDPRGWEVLAKVYQRLERPQDRARALRQLIRLKGRNPDLLADLAEALTVADQNIVPAQAKTLFQQALKIDPVHRKARFYYALTLEQEGKYNEAISIWTALLKLNPDNSQWQSMIKSRLDLARNAVGKLPKTAQKGPTREDVEAASSMSQSERMSMIEGMVANLATRLEENPDDISGWQRLINAYVVLNKSVDAQSALERAEQTFTDRVAELETLKQLRQKLNLPKRSKP